MALDAEVVGKVEVDVVGEVVGVATTPDPLSQPVSKQAKRAGPSPKNAHPFILLCSRPMDAQPVHGCRFLTVPVKRECGSRSRRSVTLPSQERPLGMAAYHAYVLVTAPMYLDSLPQAPSGPETSSSPDDGLPDCSGYRVTWRAFRTLGASRCCSNDRRTTTARDHDARGPCEWRRSSQRRDDPR